MGIGEKFQRFLVDLRTTNSGVIKARYENITRRINLDFRGVDSPTQNSRYVGSYGRGTSISASDIDMQIILPAGTYHQYNSRTHNGQSDLLQDVKKSILQTYSRTRLSGDGQVVIVEFSDNIKFEIVPVFKNTSDTYNYPDTNKGGQWKSMDPVSEIKAINAYDATYNKKVKHLVRMMKAWKNHMNVPIKGILIETLAINFMKQWQHNDKSFLYYDFMTRDFLSYLSSLDSSQDHWYIHGSNRRVYKTGNFQRYAKSSYEDALLSITCEQDPSKAHMADSKWRAIFGSNFKGQI